MEDDSGAKRHSTAQPAAASPLAPTAAEKMPAFGPINRQQKGALQVLEIVPLAVALTILGVAAVLDQHCPGCLAAGQLQPLRRHHSIPARGQQRQVSAVAGAAQPRVHACSVDISPAFQRAGQERGCPCGGFLMHSTAIGLLP